MQWAIEDILHTILICLAPTQDVEGRERAEVSFSSRPSSQVVQNAHRRLYIKTDQNAERE